MQICLKKLSYENIESSKEIQKWLSQFKEDEKKILYDLLLHLVFISRDTFSEWCNNKIGQLLKEYPKEKFALYCVRDLEDNFYWDDASGEIALRTVKYQGSEDFVCSIVGNFAKLHSNCYEHASISTLKKHKIHKIIFIDDSIGSGRKVSTFLKKVFNNKTFLSWWNYNLIKIYIISFARTKKAEEYIIKSLPGIEHYTRKYPKSNKICFISRIVYRKDDLEKRWGKNYVEIKNLCGKQTGIKNNKYGFGKVMSNIVFYHSIPNNIPGILFLSTENKEALFDSSRVFPKWLIDLLAKTSTSNKITDKKLMNEFLMHIKRGIRKKSSIALAMDCDVMIVDTLINQAIILNLIDNNFIITKAGMDFLKKNKFCNKIEYNKSLYIPKKWCINQASAQPFANNTRTDSDNINYNLSDGGFGLNSLERTDEITARPSSIIEPIYPSGSRVRFNDKGHED